MPSKPKKSLGFTLIELLVVIAIIGVLMAILMPALQMVRKQAWGITCQANLRSIGFACNFFAQDNDYKIPRGSDLRNQNPNRETTRWHNVLRIIWKRSLTMQTTAMSRSTTVRPIPTRTRPSAL